MTGAYATLNTAALAYTTLVDAEANLKALQTKWGTEMLTGANNVMTKAQVDVGLVKTALATYKLQIVA